MAQLLVDVLDRSGPPDPRSGARSRGHRGGVVRPTFVSDWSARPSIGQNGSSMDVESRDSVSLKPAELDELGQLASGVGLPLQDEQLDGHVEQFPLVAMVEVDGELQGFLFGSLERIGGTPCILWGLGGVRRGRNARPSLDALVAELYRRAAISFPDEDVLVAGRVAHPATYTLLRGARRRVPPPEVLAHGRGAGLGTSPGAPVRVRRPLRRPLVPPDRPRGAGARAPRRRGEGRAARSWSSWSATSIPPTARR